MIAFSALSVNLAKKTKSEMSVGAISGLAGQGVTAHCSPAFQFLSNLPSLAVCLPVCQPQSEEFQNFNSLKKLIHSSVFLSEGLHSPVK